MQHHRLLDNDLFLRDAILKVTDVNGAIRRSCWGEGVYLHSFAGMSFTSDDVLAMDWEVYVVSAEVAASAHDQVISNFSYNGSLVLKHARVQAKRLGHGFIGTGHILLGLIELDTGTAITVLNSLDIDLSAVCRMVKELVKDTASPSDTSNLYPLTPGAKRVFEHAEAWSKKLNCHNVGTGHILLGLLQEKENVAAHVLDYFDLCVDCVRRTIQPYDGITKENIGDILKELTYREREMLKLRYGIDGRSSYTLEEVVAVFKVTRERIRQIEEKARKKIARLTGLTKEQVKDALITGESSVNTTVQEGSGTILDMPIRTLNLSTRPRKACNRLDIATVGDLVNKTAEELLDMPNFGVSSLNEIRDALAVLGLSLRDE